MDKQKALQIIKAALDEAVKNGTYNNLETVQQIVAAFMTISNELNELNKTNEPT